jgi:RNA polymerase sigma-70 factor (ECF subfamily)
MNEMEPNNEPNWINELIRESVAGNPHAVETLFSRFGPIIEWECHQGIGPSPDASHADFCQEVRLRVWSKLDQFSGVGSPNVDRLFIAWLRKSTRSVLNNIYAHRNAAKRRPKNGFVSLDEKMDPKCQASSPSSNIARDELVQVVDRAMSTELNVQERSILRLRIMEGKSYKEIAFELSMSNEQVRYRFQQAVRRLEHKLSGD